MGSGEIVYSDECGKSNLFSPAHQRELLPLSLQNKSKELQKQREKIVNQCLSSSYYMLTKNTHWKALAR